jgi:small subunit ribosomal protein S20
MANLKSSKKDIRRSERRRVLNSQQKAAIRTFAKNVLKAVKANKKDEAQQNFNVFASLIDKAAKKKIIHKKNADRKKSRLALRISALAKTA